MTDGAARKLDLIAAVELLDEFLGATPLTDMISNLEHRTVGASGSETAEIAKAAGVTPELLVAALTVRERFGRINDVIHSVGIILALPYLLEEDERILTRPSLAAGNDPNRPFDLRTNKRAAEFKFSQWKGADAQRKRQTFKDLVLLAAAEIPGASLFVIGQEPIVFLRTCRSAASWGLDRFPAVRATFERSFGTLDITIAQFTATYASHVTITDLRSVLPATVVALLADGAV